MNALASYFDHIRDSVTSIFDGMAVTMSHMFRKPATVQYPFQPAHPERPIGGPDSLPVRYRGLLEVDMDICTACMACVRICPIECIDIDVDKVPPPDDPAGKPVRAMTRFDIDMAKCMYCGLCQEACPTGCLRHTREFEASVAHLEHLVARFVEPGKPAMVFKVRKDAGYDSVPHGSIAHTMYHDRPWDLPPIDFPELPHAEAEPAELPAPDPYSRPLSPIAAQAAGMSEAEVIELLRRATPRTDCAECGYPTCQAYAEALAKGRCNEPQRCTPGGTDCATDLAQILLVYGGVDVEAERAARAAAAETAQAHEGTEPAEAAESQSGSAPAAAGSKAPAPSPAPKASGTASATAQPAASKTSSAD